MYIANHLHGTMNNADNFCAIIFPFSRPIAFFEGKDNSQLSETSAVSEQLGENLRSTCSDNRGCIVLEGRFKHSLLCYKISKKGKITDQYIEFWEIIHRISLSNILNWEKKSCQWERKQTKRPGTLKNERKQIEQGTFTPKLIV